jgi:hypothetical protein
MANDLVPMAPSPKLGNLNSFADCIKAAKSLQRGDDAGVNTILKRAAELSLGGIEVDMLIVEIHARTGVGKRLLKKAFESLAKIVRDEKAKEEAEARKKAAADAADQWQKMREEKKERLWKSCGWMAERPDLLAGMETVVHELGVVNEGKSVRAIYLVCVSRFLDGEGARLLGLGAFASGKNYPVEQVLKLVPEYAVVQISGSSAKVLPYYGGDDADSLKGKILFVPEAVMLAKKPGEASNEFATMFRTLMSEGRLVYQTVRLNPDGTRESETKEKNGPVIAILTSADEVDHQLKTRTLILNTDESGKQTADIVRSVLTRRRGPLDLQPWLDLQELLEMDKPYKVTLPFAAAISKAFDQWRPTFLEGASMRMRRDITSFLTIVKASAVLHKFQRKTAEDGAIIAEISDYQHAYEAFDVGLASVYGEANENVIAVVEAIEEMLKEQPEADLDPDPGSRSTKVPVRELCKRLRIASTSTAKERLDEAVDAGAIEYDELKHGGRGRPRYFRVLKTAAELRAEPGLGVFPPPDEVRKYFSAPCPPENAEQNEQFPDRGAKTRI